MDRFDAQLRRDRFAHLGRQALRIIERAQQPRREAASGRIAAHAKTGPAKDLSHASSTPQITAPDLRPREIS
jgi:hypothetical protein